MRAIAKSNKAQIKKKKKTLRSSQDSKHPHRMLGASQKKTQDGKSLVFLEGKKDVSC